MFDPVLFDLSDGVATITLNRPDAGNSINETSGMALVAVVDKLRAQDAVRAVVLTGSGKKFCVGGDIDEMLHAADLSALMQAGIPRLHAAVSRPAELPCPVITAVNGPAGGGGIGLALCGDIVLASQSMKLRGGYSAIGLSPDLGASWQLARRAGAAQAKRILFLNEPVGAEECLALGLVDAVYPDDRLAEEACALAARLAAGATASFGRIKQLVDGAGTRSLQEQLALEAGYMIASAGSRDGREGVRAFMEKRSPVFRGR
ncbi:enoyl-CoA hydratase-related protein [Noviherbaspirillum aerium]|uniref:enoyl-CoA hydratase-related protein n=1 Tax=Noviherbaspirillum aerium TaxID=2588497 RepID=UPI00124EE405|nr:enoyl-CoA hydratase-related protein [Noviherbaspirillum aerium]